MSSRPGRKSEPLRIIDLTMRDGHQSLFATRARTDDLLAIAPEVDKAGFWAVEVWGGATFDAMTRFLNEDPWARLRQLRHAMPKSRLQMLLRGQNLVGYRNYPDDVVRAFVYHAADCGVDLFRVFDALNDERNFLTVFSAIKEKGKLIQGAICYSLTEPHMGGQLYNVNYYVQKALALQEMGADSVCIKDMAGLMAPDDAFKLVKALKKALKVPVALHSHFTSGMADMTYLKAIEAGVDMVDTSMAPWAYRTAHPAVEPLVVALRGTPRDTGLDLEQLLRIGQYYESLVPKYRDYVDSTRFSVIDAKVLSHRIPGSMFASMTAQLRELNSLDRLPDVFKELIRVRLELGNPPLVTPTSQIIGSQAVSNVLFGRYMMVSREIKDYVFGLYGLPPGRIDSEVQAAILRDYERGEHPIEGRAADIIAPEMEASREATAGLARDVGDVLVHALYPTTGLRFLKWKYGVEAPPPEVEAKTLEQARKEDELCIKARRGLLIEKPVVKPPPKGPDTRTYHVYVGEEYFEVHVDGAGGGEAITQAPSITSGVFPPRHSAPLANTMQSVSAVEPSLASGEKAVLAPMPALVVRYMVQPGEDVRAGAPIVVIETMKMENTLPSPAAGRVKSINFRPGDKVARNDVLAVIT
jgi:pyruvate carboxylase subunit B